MTIKEKITDISDYQELAQRTARKDMDENVRLSVAGLGLSGESGEVSELIKKYIGHGHTLDKELVTKELGDSLWYIAEICSILDIELSEVMTMNIEKLKKRYPEGFSEKRSIHRSKDDI